MAKQIDKYDVRLRMVPNGDGVEELKCEVAYTISDSNDSSMKKNQLKITDFSAEDLVKAEELRASAEAMIKSDEGIV